MSALRGSLSLVGAMLLLGLDGRTWIGLDWPAGARLGLCAGWANLVALWPAVDQRSAAGRNGTQLSAVSRPAAAAADAQVLPGRIGPYAALLWPLPALAAAGVLDWVEGAGPWDLARAMLLWLAVALAGAWVRAGRAADAGAPRVWRMALGCLAVAVVLAICAQQLGQPGTRSALFGLVPLLLACPPLGSFLAAQGAGWPLAQALWAFLLLALAACCQAGGAGSTAGGARARRWPRFLPLLVAFWAVQPCRARGSALDEPSFANGLCVDQPLATEPLVTEPLVTESIVNESAGATPWPAGAAHTPQPWPERLGSLAVRLHGPLRAVELRLAGQVLCALSLDLPSGEAVELELPFVWRDPLQIEPELHVVGAGRAESLGPAQRFSAPAVALQLLQRPLPEPAPLPGAHLPIWTGPLLLAYWVVLFAAPRGPGSAALWGRLLIWGLLPLALAGWLGWRLALPRQAPVRSTIELLDPLGPGLLQRVGRGSLELEGRPESLVTWPEWAPASLVGTWRWPTGEEQWGARAPGAQVVERRLISAPADPGETSELPRWRRAQDGNLEPIGAGHGSRATAAPSWALWATAPGQRLELAWSGREGDPVWRLGGLGQSSGD